MGAKRTSGNWRGPTGWTVGGLLVAVVLTVVIARHNAWPGGPAPRSRDAVAAVSTAPPATAEAAAPVAQEDRDPFAPGLTAADETEPAEATAGVEATEVAPVEPMADDTPEAPVVVEKPKPKSEGRATPFPSVRQPTKKRPKPRPAEVVPDVDTPVVEPVEKPVAVAAEPPDWSPPTTPDGDLELVAVIVASRSQAVFRRGGEYLRARVGEQVDGYRLERVTRGEAYLVEGGHRFSLRLARRQAGGASAKPASAPKARPAGPAPAGRPTLGPVAPPSPADETGTLP